MYKGEGGGDGGGYVQDGGEVVFPAGDVGECHGELHNSGDVVDSEAGGKATSRISQKQKPKRCHEAPPPNRSL